MWEQVQLATSPLDSCEFKFLLKGISSVVAERGQNVTYPTHIFPFGPDIQTFFFSFLNLQAAATWLSNGVSWVFSNMRILTRIKFTLRYWILEEN